MKDFAYKKNLILILASFPLVRVHKDPHCHSSWLYLNLILRSVVAVVKRMGRRGVMVANKLQLGKHGRHIVCAAYRVTASQRQLPMLCDFSLSQLLSLGVHPWITKMFKRRRTIWIPRDKCICLKPWPVFIKPFTYDNEKIYEHKGFFAESHLISIALVMTIEPGSRIV